MPSTRSGRAQLGASLIESVVAAALLGITAVVAITAWDTAIVGARHATSQAWARCVVRAEMEAVLASTGAPPAVPGVSVQIVPNPDSRLQLVTVTASDSASNQPLYAVTALRAATLAAGPSAISGSQVVAGCPSP